MKTSPIMHQCSAGLLAIVAIVVSLGAVPAWAQVAFGVAWRKAPSVLILSSSGDARDGEARDAVRFWNDTLARLGLGFRIGAVRSMGGEVPPGTLGEISQMVLGRTNLQELPNVMRTLPGDIVVVLSDENFVSFTTRWPSQQKALVAIRSSRVFPLSLPNVGRNVIAHEIGHALGLGHNGDPTLLMCGRPASCRPNLFVSDTARFFPLSADEERQLRSMYGG